MLDRSSSTVESKEKGGWVTGKGGGKREGVGETGRSGFQ